jgi:hypothetical protein
MVDPEMIKPLPQMVILNSNHISLGKVVFPKAQTFRDSSQFMGMGCIGK